VPLRRRPRCIWRYVSREYESWLSLSDIGYCYRTFCTILRQARRLTFSYRTVSGFPLRCISTGGSGGLIAGARIAWSSIVFLLLSSKGQWITSQIVCQVAAWLYWKTRAMNMISVHLLILWGWSTWTEAFVSKKQFKNYMTIWWLQILEGNMTARNISGNMQERKIRRNFGSGLIWRCKLR